MSEALSTYQIEALNRYDALMASHPQMFVGRSLRPIVTDRITREVYAAEHAVTLGVAAETPYQLFVIDLVASTISASGAVLLHPYSRLIGRGQLDGGIGVVILATIENAAIGPVGSIVMIEQERHATGDLALELPRGFAEENISGEDLALAELCEETGFIGQNPRLIGKSHPDSGATDALVAFFHVGVVDLTTARREKTEAIRAVRVMARDQVWREILSGRVMDGFTLQALALFEHRDDQMGPDVRS